MGEGGQIWLKCITGDLIMMIRDKNNIFERVQNFHADLAWNYPCIVASTPSQISYISYFTFLQMNENFICHLIGGGDSKNRLLLTTQKFLPGLQKALLTYIELL